MPKPISVCLALSLIVVLAPVAAARADTCTPTTTTRCIPNKGCTVTVTSTCAPRTSTDSSGGSGPTDCSWSAVAAQIAQIYIADGYPVVNNAPASTPTDQLTYYTVTCTGGTPSGTPVPAASGDTDFEIVIDGPGGAGGVTPGQVAQMAVNHLNLPQPSIATSPPTSGSCQECAVVVNLPTYLFVPPADWQTLTATATVASISATATAVPQSVAWTLGDGHALTCSPPQAPGVPYNNATGNGPPPPDACTYTYAYPDQTGNYSLSATVIYQVTWTSNIGQSGTIGPVPGPMARTTIQLDQIRSIVTG